MSIEPKTARLPPKWFIRVAWVVHRAIYRLTGGRRGLWPPKPDNWGTMRLTTVGRRSGKERVAILGYYEDGPNLVTMAMNGWIDAEPATNGSARTGPASSGWARARRRSSH